MTRTSPELDDWENVDGIETPLNGALTGTVYDAGSSKFQCLYDDTKIYLAMTIPGFYKFSAEDDHLCAAIGTMTKIGADATYYNMGGCPDASPSDTCNATTIEACESHRVDLGAHWELKTTEQGVEYTIGLVNPDDTSTAVQAQELLPTGNDLIANKDDEYGVSPTCRFDDDDALAGNEWAGAWKHTNPIEGELGDYIFELSRLLTTKSSWTDAQMKAGDKIEFGIAFWDPLEQADGWSKAGHYITGCGTSWIELELVVPGTEVVVPTDAPSGGMTRGGLFLGGLASLMLGTLVL